MTMLIVSIKYLLVIRDWAQVAEINITDAIACGRKYLMAASVDLKFNSLSIRGIKLIKLISRPTQHVNHELADTATAVPEIRKRIKNN